MDDAMPSCLGIAVAENDAKKKLFFLPHSLSVFPRVEVITRSGVVAHVKPHFLAYPMKAV